MRFRKTVFLMLVICAVFLCPISEALSQEYANAADEKNALLKAMNDEIDSSEQLSVIPNEIMVQCTALPEIEYDDKGNIVSIDGVKAVHVSLDPFIEEFKKGIFKETEYVLRISEDEDIDAVIDYLNSLSHVRYAIRHFEITDDTLHIDASYNESRPVYSRGDVNGNGKIGTIDYAMCKRLYLGTNTFTPSPEQLAAADANGNGRIDTADYAMIRRYVLRTFYFPPTW